MPTNTIDLAFGDGEYSFALAIEQIVELQEKCKIGIGGLNARLLKGCALTINGFAFDPTQVEFHVLDIVEPIRLGLIGGGKGVVNGEEVKVTPLVANKLVQRYVLAFPLMANLNAAATIVGTCVVGYDPPKKDEPGDDRADEPVTSETTDTSITA